MLYFILHYKYGGFMNKKQFILGCVLSILIIVAVISGTVKLLEPIQNLLIALMFPMNLLII